MTVKAALLSRWFAPRVLHRLPGRVRISVPLLRRVPDEGKPLARKLEPLFLLREGIQSVQVGFLTGNVLVRFDARRLDEQHVLRWTSLLHRMISEHWDRLEAIPSDRVSSVIGRVRGVLAAAAQDDPRFARGVVIPSDVWG
jgi:hypothetical protein